MLLVYWCTLNFISLVRTYRLHFIVCTLSVCEQSLAVEYIMCDMKERGRNITVNSQKAHSVTRRYRWTSTVSMSSARCTWTKRETRQWNVLNGSTFMAISDLQSPQRYSSISVNVYRRVEQEGVRLYADTIGAVAISLEDTCCSPLLRYLISVCLFPVLYST